MHEDATVVLSRDGWLKRVREVKDPTSTRLREGDALAAVLPGSTRDRLVLFFSNRGTVYVLRVGDVPATTGYGEPVQSLFKFGDGERVVAARLIRESTDAGGVDRRAAGAPRHHRAHRRGAGGLVATASGYGFRATPDLIRDDARRPPLARVGDGDEIVGVDARARAGRDRRDGARQDGALSASRSTEVPSSPAAGRGVILMKPEPRTTTASSARLALGKKDELDRGSRRPRGQRAHDRRSARCRGAARAEGPEGRRSAARRGSARPTRRPAEGLN